MERDRERLCANEAKENSTIDRNKTHKIIERHRNREGEREREREREIDTAS